MRKEIWQKPKLEKSLDEAQTPLWFWNDKIERTELVRQLELTTEVGVTSINPHARTNNGEGYIGGYLDKEWFDNLQTVLDYKKEKNEIMWLYDEIDWPAGTCDKTITRDEENREKYIKIEQAVIAPNEKFRLQLQTFEGKGLYGITENTNKEGLAYNVIIVDAETKEIYNVENYFVYEMFGPELEFVSKRESIAFIIQVCVNTYEAGGSLQVNYIDEKVTKKFLASTYDKYYENFGEEFGKTITTVFNDETRMCNAIVWSNEFADKFLEIKGYDIRNCIHQLLLDDEKSGRVRCDYFDMVATLFQQNYFKVISEWCKNHDLKFFAHLLGEETLYGHARYSGDYLRQNKYQDVCGADHLGKGVGSLNIKFTSCGAHSYGKRRTAVEVFAGCGWDMTFEEYSRIVTWMFQQGMQIIINHGFFYSDRGERKNDWPPSQFFQWNGWSKMSEGNDMVRRLSYGLTDGINEADILVYNPIESFWFNYIPDTKFTHGFFNGPILKHDKSKKIDFGTQSLLNGLLSENLDFDLIHKDAVENFIVEDRKIKNTLSGQVFSVLVLPMCQVLPIEMARLCRELSKQGGKIVVVDDMPSVSMKLDQDEELKRIFEEINEKGNLILTVTGDTAGIYESIRKQIPMPIEIVQGVSKTINNHPTYGPYLIDPYIHTGEDLRGVFYNRYLKDGMRNTLFMNYNDHEETIQVKVGKAERLPEIWNTFTGEIKKAKVVQDNVDSIIVELDLPCNYGMFLVSDI